MAYIMSDDSDDGGDEARRTEPLMELIANLKDENESLHHQLQTARKHMETVEGTVAYDLDKENIELKNQLAGMKKDVQKLESTVDDLKFDITALTNRNSSLTKLLANEKDKFQKLDDFHATSVKNHTEAISVLQTERNYILGSLKEVQETQQKTHSKLQRESTTFAVDVKALKDDNDMLMAEIKEHVSSRRKLEADFDAFKKWANDRIDDLSLNRQRSNSSVRGVSDELDPERIVQYHAR